MTPQQLKHSILKIAFSGKLIEPEINAKPPKVKAVECEEATFDIPENWVWSTLGNCCDLYTGNSISESVKKAKYTGRTDGLDYIATKDVTFENTIIYDNGVRIPLCDNFRIAKAGSVLMCIEGGSAGRKIGIIDRDVCFGNKLCMFDSDIIANKYVFYYLQSSEFKRFFAGNMSGIIGGVSIKKLKDLPIPIPSLNEQLSIVKKIEELLPYVDRYAAAYEKLEQFNAKFPDDMKKSILQYAIQGKLVEQRPEEGTGEELYRQIQTEKQRMIKEGKIKKEKPLAEIAEDEIPFDIPESWALTRLGNVISLFSGTDFKPEEYNDQENGIPYITGASSLSAKGVLVNRWTETPRILANYGDVLLVCKGSGYGKTVICDIPEAHIARQIMAVKKNDNLNMEYIKYFLQANVKLIKSKGQGVIPGIDRGSVLNLIFPLPPLAEQKRIVAKLEEVLPLCERLK
ncbi:MAG: restriction endonuclease subunit S [Eubacteriaceae bacterium]|nr:restriction endonuclease subunit S [Eubacteriaceae bacterium]